MSFIHSRTLPTIALVCEQYDGILIPERYLDEQIKSVLYELYCDAEKISV
ncbi:MAG: hypothetical protein ACTTKC_07420 [Treponema sp.]